MSSESSSTVLHPPWLGLARLAWLFISLAAFVAFVFGATNIIRSPLPSCQEAGILCGPWSLGVEDIVLARQSGLPVELMLFAYYFNSIVPKVFFFLVGLFIFWRRSDDWMALLLSIMLTTFAIEGITDLGSLTPLITAIYALASGAFILLPFVFPSGRIEPPWMRRFLPFILTLAVFASLMPYLSLDTNETLYSILVLFAYALWFLAGGYAAVYRYKNVSSPVERQQTKWVMLSILGQTITFVPFGIIALFFPPSQPSVSRLAIFFFGWLPVGFLSYMLLSLGIAFAILRYRLWDIDLVIRRTLKYSLLSGLLALVYLGAVTILQNLFTAATGQTSPLALVLSTLGIAALFTPLRSRVQDFIDRRFYRQKYDAEQALAAFTAVARSETDLAQLSARLTETVLETLQPKSLHLWILRNREKSKIQIGGPNGE
jgi:hypothetical protein